MRIELVAGLTGLALFLASGAAPAQAPGGRYSRPNYGPGYRGNISPYLNIFRSFIPRIGPLDVSPIVAILVLSIVGGLVVNLVRG